MQNGALARSSLAAVRALALRDDEQAQIADELAQTAELVLAAESAPDVFGPPD